MQKRSKLESPDHVQRRQFKEEVATTLLLLVSYLARAFVQLICRYESGQPGPSRIRPLSDCVTMASRIAVATRSRFDLLQQDELEQSESEDEIDAQELEADES